MEWGFEIDWDSVDWPKFFIIGVMFVAALIFVGFGRLIFMYLFLFFALIPLSKMWGYLFEKE